MIKLVASSFIALLTALAITVAASVPTGRLTLAWDYPTNELSTNLTFKLYRSTNVAIPLTNWLSLTNTIGTNVSVQVQVVPGPNFFVITASNLWGESEWSNIALTPPLATFPTNLSITRPVP